MAYFSKLGLNGKVLEVVSVNNDVITDENGIEQEQKGIDFLTEQTNWPVWVQCSYNTRQGQHSLGGTPFRKNYPGPGYKYDEDRDAFIPPKSYRTWVLNEETCEWEPPIAYPDDGQHYKWNETTQQWDLINE